MGVIPIDPATARADPRIAVRHSPQHLAPGGSGAPVGFHQGIFVQTVVGPVGVIQRAIGAQSDTEVGNSGDFPDPAGIVKLVEVVHNAGVVRLAVVLIRTAMLQV